MFQRWGAFVYRHRRIVALVALVVAVVALPFATRASGKLSSGGWLDPASESSQVGDRLAAQFGGGKSSLVALFTRTQPGADATSAEFQGAIGTATAVLRTNPNVTGTVGYAETGDRRFISTKGEAAYIVINLAVTDEESVPLYRDLRAQLAPPAGYAVTVSGYAPFTLDTAKQAEEDLLRAELVSLPIVAIVLFLVFTSAIAAGMPLLVAGLAIPTSLGLVYWVAQITSMSIFVLNIASMLGLALAIDYSLFLVSRFREELARGREVGDAVARAVATSGKAVFFSGIAVAIGLSGLMVFPFATIRSIGLGSALVVACSVFFALTFLPAVLGMLGHRVNQLSLAGLRHRLRGERGPIAEAEVVLEVTDPDHPSRWGRVARRVMAHPWRVLLPVLALLLVLGTPFLRLEQGVPGAEVLPVGLESRDTFVALQADFAPGETTPMVILADLSAEPTSPAGIAALQAYANRLAALDGVSRVESFFTITDPSTGLAVPPAQVQMLFALPAAQRPAGVAALLASYVSGNTVRLSAISPYVASRPEATSLVPRVRALPVDAPITRTSLGGTAALGSDFLAGQADRLPFAVGWTMLATAVILFLLFGSVVLPLKAVLMTLLSATASFGALVWIFQDGNLSNLLAFQSPGFTVAGIPIIMFCVIFGLSMDYEVLLLSRIQEAWRRTGDNTASVVEGVVRTARVITGAALIMVSVFFAFVLADEVTIKSIGVGMAIAVAIDASIVRVTLVPAVMRLLGPWNWWAPGPLGRIADRVGFSHVDDDDPQRPPGAAAHGTTERQGSSAGSEIR
jgi:RND superfamily putative drug exporter